jgi:hypothetical protein
MGCTAALLGYAMTQAVSGLPLTMKDQIQCQINPHGIFCGQSDNEAGFSPNSLALHCKYCFIPVFY